MVRNRIQDIIKPEDETLNEVMEKCKVVDVLMYAGNISSILLLPLVVHLFKEIREDFRIYTEEVFLYAFDDVLELDNCVYIVMPLSTARKKFFKGTVFSILSRSVERYYYDADNVIFCYQVPDKYQNAYQCIINGDYGNVGLHYLLLSEKGGVVRSICLNHETLRDQWKTLEELLQTDGPIISEDSAFPKFYKENETYYARTKNKK